MAAAAAPPPPAAGAIPGPVVGSPAFQHPYYTQSPAFQQLALPTPSPFQTNVSAASTSWSSKPVVLKYSTLALRLLASIFGFAAAVPLLPSPNSEFVRRQEFRYCIAVAAIGCFYSAFQLLKGILEIAGKCLILSYKKSDYTTFILDQVMSYLLLSSSSVSVLGVQRLPRNANKVAAVVSVCMSFAAFVAIAVSSLFSGHKLCKRIIW